MRKIETGTLSEKSDGALNELVLRIKKADVNGVDAFVLYKQGKISKQQLCEAIASSLHPKEER